MQMFYESKFHLIDQHFRYNRPYCESARKMAQKYNFSQEETLVVYTENKFNIHEYFFLIVSAVFLFKHDISVYQDSAFNLDPTSRLSRV